MNGFLISAPQSGSGKTTVSLAIMAAMVRRGLAVAPFKCGPDFIDPGYHRAVTGSPSINLDGWMCPGEFVYETFQARLNGPTGQKFAVIEGAMGLFDGIGASSKEGSSAQIAAITGAPVILVVNASGMAASAAALIKGFAGFDPQVRIAGVIFNNVGSSSHSELLLATMAENLPEIALFGCIPRDGSLVIPSRHLGLVTTEDNPLSEVFISRLADMAERCLDLDRLSRLQIPPYPPFIKGGDKFAPISTIEGDKFAAASTIEGDTFAATSIMVGNNRASTSTIKGDRFPPPFMKGGSGGICLAVARDPAFCFMYEDNLRLLREAGAELVFFSPLADAALPPRTDGIYLPGGYPELYAEQLNQNRSMKESIRTAVAADLPVYAECGGFVYLTEGIDESENQPMADFVGIFPVRCRMLPRRKALGYRQAELTETAIIGATGTIVRGHEFHYSEIRAMPEDVRRCYRVSRQGVVLGFEGFRIRNCLGSYIHLHFGSNRDIAANFVAACGKRS